MKKMSLFGKVTKTLIVIPLIVISAFSATTNASQISDQDLAKQSVSNYFNAIQDGDISEAVKWVIDTRFNSPEEQATQYQELLITDPFSNPTIESINSNSDGSYTATIELTRKDDGSLNEITLPIVQKDGSWKLLIEGTEIRDKNVITTYLNENKSESTITPMASVNIGNYEDWLSKSDETYSNGFNMHSSSIGVTVWQYNPGSTDPVYVTYLIVIKGYLADLVLGETIHGPVYRPTTGSADYIVINNSKTGNAQNGVNLKIINPSAASGVYVKGYIYENQ
ncbi:hypothetical protein H70357_11470 [Paenibacillus sp. FSL H7-0357]|uniref:hypothetical protein n=1 Tax=unclassified Paenibacillus TaxID=185978 RepID=UPI0004F6F630|nr:hypothetical protein [Paenibacillus sp. FSL H7-0357]AIQ17209.1 hypothetical protein H70357_11470 [Paenibacillus sp. FSL H7-0357]